MRRVSSRLKRYAQNNRTSAKGRADSACGSMVRCDHLCAVFPRSARKNRTPTKESTALRRQKRRLRKSCNQRKISMEAIQLEHVSKVYHIGAVETQALNDVSLSIAEGEFTALVGPSGSGKTTLLQLIGCLDKPDRGAVNFQGQDVTRLSANQRA